MSEGSYASPELPRRGLGGSRSWRGRKGSNESGAGCVVEITGKRGHWPGRACSYSLESL
jgi:hypothetical protein